MYIPMSSASRAHIHNIDAKWMNWLKRCSRLKGCSGKALLDEYAKDKNSWHISHQKMRLGRFALWPFCRGELSVSEINDARHRYLDRYVFVAGDHEARAYVDALLATEEAQIRARLDDKRVMCPGCADRESLIAKLRMALCARDIHTESEVTVAAVSSIFYRYYMLADAQCTRTEVREQIQKVLQEEVSTAEVLPSSSEAWTVFMRDSLGFSTGSSGPIRCRRRMHPLPAPTALGREEGGGRASDASQSCRT